MKSFVVAAMLLVACALPANANDIYVYKGTDTNPVAELLNAERITFDANGMNVRLADGTVQTAAFADFDHFTFYKKEILGIQSLNAGAQDGVLFDGNRLTLTGASQVTVYSALGAQLYQEKLGGNTSTVSLDFLPKGIYIVKAVCNGKVLTRKISK
ncbi:MAG: T9SS type A sorting domain-containing protein [Bacteroidaceae bacterium]|nr:T9SS type A sorting domain-containing protein [Bacteroidaceae bacterium]